MANQWFRLYSEFAFDPKVQMLSESDQRRLIMLFCLRCSNADVTLQDKHVTFQLRISNEEWAVTKAVFIENGFINSENNVLNWDKRQYVSDSSAERVARHREKARNANVTTCNVTVTPPDTEQIQIQKQKQSKSKSKELPEKSGQFVLPDWIRTESWDGFVAMRKSIKKPLTPHAVELMICSLEKMRADGEDVNAVLEQSIMNSWQGVFPLKTPQRTSFSGQKAQKEADSRARLDAWARGEQASPKSTYIEGEFGRA